MKEEWLSRPSIYASDVSSTHARGAMHAPDVSLTKRTECIYSGVRDAQRESQRRETALPSPELQRTAPHGTGRGNVRAGFVLYACAAPRAAHRRRRTLAPPCPTSRPAFLSSASVRGRQQSSTSRASSQLMVRPAAGCSPARHLSRLYQATEVVRMKPTPSSGARRGRLFASRLGGGKLTTMGEERWI